MKAKFLISLFFIVCSITLASAYNWIPYGPQGNKVTNICFGFDTYGAICTEGGMYLYMDDMEWHYYSYGLPIVEVAYYSTDKIILIMGDGSYSDGIYTFDLQANNFEVIEWIYKPRFLRYYEYNNSYYVAGEQEGLLFSNNGLDWATVSYFDTISCYDIAFYDQNIVVSEGDGPYNDLHLSADGGDTWQMPDYSGYYTEVEFKATGDLFAIFPGMSNSAGVYKSVDYGYNWEPLNWEFFMTSLACDPFGNILIGWGNGNGVARLDPNIWDPPFVYLNEGLPDTHVHAIKINPAMSAPNVFVCTDNGVYHSYDYLTGTNERSSVNTFNVYPNPARKEQHLTIKIPHHFQTAELKIYDGYGKLMHTDNLEGSYHSMDNPCLPAGIYYCVLISGTEKMTRKIVVN